MALINVLRNGVQATEQDGEVTLRLQEKEQTVVIECVDTGRGMADEELDKIFNAFYTTRERGTGLGLAITRKIIVSHGGSVNVDSEPDQGTRIRLILPRSP